MKALGVTKDVAELVITRDSGTCRVRAAHFGGRPYDVLHHRLPRQMGGSREPYVNDASNLICLCNDCHDWIEKLHRDIAKAHGWLVPRGTLPAEALILLDQRTWGLLQVDGSIVVP